jgi:hypothetical protein
MKAMLEQKAKVEKDNANRKKGAKVMSAAKGFGT